MRFLLLSRFFLLMLFVFVSAGRVQAQEADDLKITDLVVGKGDQAQRHMEVSVHYTGWLLDGTKFDSSLDRGRSFNFTLGTGEVIRGWDVGVAGMKVGGKRELVIPPALAYGAQGAGDVIPADATLKFEIELLGVKPAAYRMISLDDIPDLMKAGAKLVDIRSLAEAKDTGVIKGARVMTAFDRNYRFQQRFITDFQAYVNREDPVILIGPDGPAVPSLAHIIASQGGYLNVHALELGMPGWVAAGKNTVAP